MVTDTTNSPFGSRRVWYWLIGSVLGWGIVFLVIGLPIFHLGFRVPISTIASYLGICSLIQLAITPWFYYGRKTPQRPEGRPVHLTLAATVGVATMTVLFCFYLRLSRPDDLAIHKFTSIMMGVTVVFALLYPSIRLASRRKLITRTGNR
jgi:hypothetical protein